MEHLLELAKRNQERAWEVIRQTDIINIWKSVGAEINLVGSLNMGLLMKHKDIDFHIYTSPFRISDSFQAMARLAENPLIKRIEDGNSLDTEERCVEWHAWFQDPNNELWQIDMIHIVKGSRYDGYFEKMAERITAVLTDETRQAILKLKYETNHGRGILPSSHSRRRAYVCRIRGLEKTTSSHRRYRMDSIRTLLTKP